MFSTFETRIEYAGTICSPLASTVGHIGSSVDSIVIYLYITIICFIIQC